MRTWGAKIGVKGVPVNHAAGLLDPRQVSGSFLRLEPWLRWLGLESHLDGKREKLYANTHFHLYPKVCLRP